MKPINRMIKFGRFLEGDIGLWVLEFERLTKIKKEK